MAMLREQEARIRRSVRFAMETASQAHRFLKEMKPPYRARKRVAEYRGQLAHEMRRLRDIMRMANFYGIWIGTGKIEKHIKEWQQFLDETRLSRAKPLSLRRQAYGKFKYRNRDIFMARNTTLASES